LEGGWREYKLKVLENRVLRRIFGPKRDEVTRLIINVKQYFVAESIFILSVGKSLGKPGSRWADIIKMVREEIA
jgi:hypothetical protein